MREKKMFWEINQKSNSNQSINITISNNRTLNIDKGKFEGDIEEAKRLLQEFCNENTVTAKGMRGYGTVTVNNTAELHYNPYGIDIIMMLEFCGIQNTAALAM